MIPNEFFAHEADEVFSAFASSLESGDLTPAFRSCIEVASEGFSDNFGATKAPYGTWPPHSPVTVAIHGPHPLLILTGDMYRAVTKEGSEGRIQDLEPRSLVLGTDLFYAAWQQYGTAKIPPRPFLWLDKPFVVQVTEVFADASYRIFVGV